MGIIPRRPVRGPFEKPEHVPNRGRFRPFQPAVLPGRAGAYFDSTASRSHSPDRPPLFINNRTGPIATPRSRLLTMS